MDPRRPLERHSNRRLALATICATPLALAACGSPPVRTFATLAAAIAAIESLASGHKLVSSWSLSQMLNHAAQSVEFSLRGFPDMKSAAFRATVGSAAFAWFDSRGAMSHGLDEAIPGAPALAADAALPDAIARAVKALRDFDAHTGMLAPHFAYGALDKAQYTRAHLMHLANHWSQVSAA
jgi:hypothetical protein